MPNHLTATVDGNNVMTISMNSPPANTLTFELMTELLEQLELVEQNACSALILVSSLERTFCSGLNLNQLLQQQQLEEFLGLFETVWFKLVQLPIPTAAAITGHAIAGGCCLAIATDYRCMFGSSKIGLTGAKIGVKVPYFIADYLETIVGQQLAKRLCLSGEILDASEALKINLVHEISDSKNNLIQMAVDKIANEIKLKSSEKIRLPENLILKRQLKGDQLVSEWAADIRSEESQAKINTQLKSISKKK